MSWHPQSRARLRISGWILASLVSIATLPSVIAQQPSAIRLSDVTQLSGIDFVHCDGSNGAHLLVEAMASGLASLDYDSDGLMDVYFANGNALTSPPIVPAPINELFRNIGEMKFTSVAEACGLDDDAFTLGVTVGDYNNDGFEDVYLSNFGANSLYANNGDGTFTRMDSEAIRCGNKTGAGVSMFDADADGDLDIYAASYIEFDFKIKPPTFLGRTIYGGPLDYPKSADNFLLNRGDGTFEDQSEVRNIQSAAEWGMGTVAFDCDQDGDVDVFVANDSTRNLLWVNDGRGYFSDEGLLAGLEYDDHGSAQGSMGVDVADCDGDQLLDLYQTAYTRQVATLYRNLGAGLFQASSSQLGAGAGTYYTVNWGVAFGDLDNDRDQDIYIANGHIHDNLDDLNSSAQYKMKNQLFENRDGRFSDISASAGTGLDAMESSRGLVAEDFDHDGRLDIIVLNSRTTPTVLKNESQPHQNWITIELIGVVDNRSAINAKVTVRDAEGRDQTAEKVSGRGYQSHFGSRLHFGLGEFDSVRSITVQWPNQQVQRIAQAIRHNGDIEALRANAHYVIRQGELSAVQVEVNHGSGN